MENFEQRALAWAKANPYCIVSTYANSINGSPSSLFNYQCLCTYWSVTHKKPLTEVILEWENEMSNEMPKLEAGMVVKRGDNQLILYIGANSSHIVGYIVGQEDAGWRDSCRVEEITAVYENPWQVHYGLPSLQEELLKPIWQRESKEESELKSVIADLEENLADAKERLKAIK